jgi:hypothetical protein
MCASWGVGAAVLGGAIIGGMLAAPYYYGPAEATVFGTPAEAQNYPWCGQYTGSISGAMNCGFSTFQQCMADVSGIGGFLHPKRY